MVDVPDGLKVTAAWAWRLLVVAAALAGLSWLLAEFSGVTVPLAIALLLVALLDPLVRRLRALGTPPVLASLMALLALVLVIVGIFVLIGTQVASQSSSLADQTLKGVEQLMGWLSSGPLHLDPAQIDGWIDQLTTWVSNSRADIASYLGRVGGQLGHFLAGTAIALVAAFFFGYDGQRMWQSFTGWLPEEARAKTYEAGRRGWESLVSYMRATVLVSLVDALGVLLAALVLGLPLPWALFALTWIASFVPILGAVTAGFVAVVLALVTHGWVSALLMLGAVVLVMELESHFLQPILLSRAVKIHPLAVLLGIAVGSAMSGIVGALMAIPVVAFMSAVMSSLRSHAPQPVVIDESSS